MTLERELAVYHEHLPRWLAEGRRGQWVAIWNGDWVLGFFRTMNEALSAGYWFPLSVSEDSFRINFEEEAQQLFLRVKKQGRIVRLVRVQREVVAS